LSVVLLQGLSHYSEQPGKSYSSNEAAEKLSVTGAEQTKNKSLLFTQEDNARKLLIAEGSSTTEGYGVTNEYARQLAVLFGGNYYRQSVNLILDSSNQWSIRNVGNSGDTMTGMIAQYASQVLPFYSSSRTVNYLTLQGGSNDIALGRSAAALEADVAAYVARAKADGFVVGVCTVFHRVGNDVGKVNEYNNWLRAGNSGADFIVDLAAQPQLSDATNPTYFQYDGVHTNNAGQTVIANVFAASIPTLGAASLSFTVSGKVTNSRYLGISNISLTLTDQAGNTKTVLTDSFGFYRFADVPAGDAYMITAKGKRYTFYQPSRLLNVNDNVTDVNFVANTSLKNFY
jgi:lysophospholipase L1-like esterase